MKSAILALLPGRDDIYGVSVEIGTAVCNNTMETCPYNHPKINFVLFGWMYSYGTDKHSWS